MDSGRIHDEAVGLPVAGELTNNINADANPRHAKLKVPVKTEPLFESSPSSDSDTACERLTAIPRYMCDRVGGNETSKPMHLKVTG